MLVVRGVIVNASMPVSRMANSSTARWVPIESFILEESKFKLLWKSENQRVEQRFEGLGISAIPFFREARCDLIVVSVSLHLSLLLGSFGTNVIVLPSASISCHREKESKGKGRYRTFGSSRWLLAASMIHDAVSQRNDDACSMMQLEDVLRNDIPTRSQRKKVKG